MSIRNKGGFFLTFLTCKISNFCSFKHQNTDISHINQQLNVFDLWPKQVVEEMFKYFETHSATSLLI